MKGMKGVCLEVGTGDPGGTTDSRNKEDSVHIQSEAVDGPEDQSHENPVAAPRAERGGLEFGAKVFFHGPGHQTILPISSIRRLGWMISPSVWAREITVF